MTLFKNLLNLILNVLPSRIWVTVLCLIHFPAYFLNLTAQRLRRGDNPGIISLIKGTGIGFILLLGLMSPSYFFQLPTAYFVLSIFCVGIPLLLTITYLSMVFVLTLTFSFLYSFYQGMLYGVEGYHTSLITIEAHLRVLADRQLFEDIDEFRAFIVLFKTKPQNQLDLRSFELKPLEFLENRLLDTELAHAKHLISNGLKLSLTPEQTAQRNTLKLRCEQYEHLNSRLAKVHDALLNESLAELQDELIVFCAVENPLFLVKQYQKQDQWYSVPADGKITDKGNLTKWFKTSNMHPANKDSLLEPQKYQEYPARYRWHELSKNHCYAEGLGEYAEEIRGLVRILSLLLATPSAPKPSCLSALSFYNSPSSNDQHSADMPREHAPI